jgi:hypothetical protein
LTTVQLDSLILGGATLGDRFTPDGAIVNAYQSLKLAAKRHGAPLCGNRIWVDSTLEMHVERGGPSDVEIIASGLSADIAQQLYPMHGGRQILDVDLTDFGSGFEPFLISYSAATRSWTTTTNDTSFFDGLTPLDVSAANLGFLGHNHDGDSSLSCGGVCGSSGNLEIDMNSNDCVLATLSVDPNSVNIASPATFSFDSRFVYAVASHSGVATIYRVSTSTCAPSGSAGWQTAALDSGTISLPSGFVANSLGTSEDGSQLMLGAFNGDVGNGATLTYFLDPSLYFSLRTPVGAPGGLSGGAGIAPGVTSRRTHGVTPRPHAPAKPKRHSRVGPSARLST